jgi:hypothetical protein
MVSIDTVSGALATHAADMPDIELVFCKDRGQTDILVEQLERILRFEIATDRGRTIAAALIATVNEELAGAHARWTPAYDVLLRDLLAAREALAAVASDDPPPWAECGDHETDRDVVAALHRRFVAHARVLDLLEEADGSFLSDAWAACRERADAIVMLDLAVDPSEVRERLRRALIDHLAARDSCDCAPIAEATCLRVARAASLGAEDWAIVERVRRALQTFPHENARARCRPHAIAVACRRDASLAELLRAAEIMAFSELVARMGNPSCRAGETRYRACHDLRPNADARAIASGTRARTLLI